MDRPASRLRGPMSARHVALAISVLATSGVLACRSPTAPVRLHEVNVSGTITSSRDGSPIEGVSLTVGDDFVGLFGGGEGSLGEGTETAADGTYALHLTSPSSDGWVCNDDSPFWLKVYLLDGWTMSKASAGSLDLRCTEKPQVIDVQLTPTS